MSKMTLLKIIPSMFFHSSNLANIKAIFSYERRKTILAQKNLYQDKDYIYIIGSIGSASNAGDVNSDGIDDIIISAPATYIDDKGFAGESYVIFGSQDLNGSEQFDLKDFDGSNGFAIKGSDAGDLAGTSVSNAGDVNNDGIDDVIIGAIGANPNSKKFAGEVYVVYGSPKISESGSLELSDLDGSNGFTIKGLNQEDRVGTSVSNAGDVNNDGIDDIVLSRYNADIRGKNDMAQSYVIFGSRNISDSGDFDLNSLDGSNGFALNGTNSRFEVEAFVSNAGDVNNDGIDDIVVGGPDVKGNRDAETYVVFGSSQIGLDGSRELSALDGSNGFIIKADNSIRSASDAGDVNNDGIDDLVIGLPNADSNGVSSAGAGHVVFGNPQIGSSGKLNLSQLNKKDGFTFSCAQKSPRNKSSTFGAETDGSRYGCGNSASNAGDLNSDGIGDLIIGATNASKSYVIYGSDNPSSFKAFDLSREKGFEIESNDSDNLGLSVSNAGDVNNDGIDDAIVRASGSDANSYLVFGGRQSVRTISSSEDEISKPDLNVFNLIENQIAIVAIPILLTASWLCFSVMKKTYTRQHRS